MNLGHRIKQLRISNNYKAGEFARLLGITPVFLSYIESNTKKPSFDTLEKICTLLNISLSEFFNDGTAETVPNNFKEFISKNKNLTAEQLEQLSKFIESIK